MTTKKETPRVYVACLASYNAGIHHGEWIDATDADTMRDEIDRILRASPCPNVEVDCPENHHRSALESTEGPPWVARDCAVCKGKGKVPSAEEWAFHDYDGIPSTFGEHPDLDDVAEAATFIEEHGELARALISHFCGNLTEAIEALSDHYAGAFDSLENWAEVFLDDTGMFREVDEKFKQYFDFEKFARDCELGGDVWTLELNGEVHVFNSN